MKLFRLRIEPTSAWRTPWQADTTAGLLCWMLARTEGPEALERDLLDPARRGRPPFVLSDAFPEDLLPVPAALRLLPVAAEARKQVKRARWMRWDDFRRMQRGALPDAAALIPEEQGVALGLQIRNTLDRQRDSSIQAGGVFAQGQSMLVRERKWLSIYARIVPGWEARLLGLFRELSQIGYGADSSTGRGQFEIGADLEPVPDLDDVPAPNTAVSLSTFQPDPRSEPDGAWELFTKYGKLGPDFGLEQDEVFKRPLVLLHPGACLRAREPRPFAGRFIPMKDLFGAEAITALIARGVDAGHFAYGLTVPARLDWDTLLAESVEPVPPKPASARGVMESRHFLLLLDLEDEVPEGPIVTLLPTEASPPIVLRARKDFGAPSVCRHGPDARPVDWAGVAGALVRMAQAARSTAREGPHAHFWIAGKAPLPVFVQLGMLLSAWAGEQTVVNQRKDGALDVMPLQGVKALDPLFDVVTGLPDESSQAAGRLAVFVSTGLLPERDRLRTFVLEGAEPFAGLVEIRASSFRYLDAANAAATAEELARHISRIPGVYPHAQDIALFVAGPASLAYIAGRAINPHVIRNVWVANRTGEGPSGHELAFVLPFRPAPGQGLPDDSKAELTRAGAHAPKQPMIRIEEVRLSHFRAMEDVRLSLSDLTLLVGRNGAGKTTIAEALDFLRDALTEGLQTALERRGDLDGIRQRGADDGPRGELPAVSIAVVLRVSPWPDPARAERNKELHPAAQLPADERVLYGLRLQTDPVSAELLIDEVLRTSPGGVSFERRGTEVTSALREIPKSAAAGSLMFPLIAGLHPGWALVMEVLRGLRVYALSPAAIRGEWPIGSASYLLRDGKNSGDILKAMEAGEAAASGKDNDKATASGKEDVGWLVAHLARITPGLVGVRAGSQAGRRILKFLQRMDDDEQSGPVAFRGEEMSDGTLRALGVLLALRQRPAPSLVFIDEIEDSIHPAALSVLLDAAEVTAAERCQVVLTSHSPEVLSHPAVNGDNVRIVAWRGGRSHIHLLSAGTRECLVPPDTVGDLLRVNALQPDEAPLRVEGDVFELA